MTRTEDLIDHLAGTGTVTADAPRRVLAWPVIAAALVCLVLLALAFGRPLGALPQVGLAPYAMKLAFALGVAAAGLFALHVAGRPGRALRLPLIVLAIPFAAVLVLAVLEIAALGPAWPGATWLRCLASVSLLGLGAALLIGRAMRSLAPTRLRLAGALAGLGGGGLAASCYALWCPETTALFLASWYALPILALGGAGALGGPRLLRW